jgi:hypothetical protein
MREGISMNIQEILPQVNNIASLSSNNITCSNEFDKILQQVNEQSDIEEMKKFLDEKFNINTVVVEYSCERTDSEAEMYDTSMLDKYDLNGGRNVIISKKTLLRIKKDSSFRQKVYKSIQEIPFSNKSTGGCEKSNGVFIHEDGTGGYYLEFDWGDEEEQPKSKIPKVSYYDGITSAYDGITSARYESYQNLEDNNAVLATALVKKVSRVKSGSD